MYTGGEIADLARIARPRIGVVTAVQPVHLSRIGSLEAIEAAKGELLEALPADGAAILNADDPIVRRMGTRSAARSVTYGFAADADVGAEAVESAGTDGMRFVLRTDAGSRPVTIPTLGRLSVHNALAGAAVGRRRRALARRDRRRPGGRLVGAAPGPARPSRRRDDRRRQLQRLAAVRGRRPGPAGRVARPPGGRARRDARARRGERRGPSRRRRGRRPDRRLAGRGRAGCRVRSPRGRWRPGWTRTVSSGSAMPRPPSTCCRPGSATATSSWSRRRAGSAWIASSTASATTSVGAPAR